MELKAEVSERAEKGRARSRWFNRRGIAMVAGLAAAAAAVAVVVPIVTGGGTAAFAVSKNADGSVDVRIDEFRDPEKLEQALKAEGVTAQVEYRMNEGWNGLQCVREGGTEVPEYDGEPGKEENGRLSLDLPGNDDAETAFRLFPKRFEKDETLVLDANEIRADSDPTQASMDWQWHTVIFRGPVPACTWEKFETSGEPADPSPSANPEPSGTPESAEDQVTSTKG